MIRPAPPRRRRAGLLPLACLPLLALAGCEEPDDSIRGAGSIHIPHADLRLPPIESAEADPPAPVATLPATSPHAEAAPGR